MKKLDITTIFIAPKGYFDELPKRITRRLKTRSYGNEGRKIIKETTWKWLVQKLLVISIALFNINCHDSNSFQNDSTNVYGLGWSAVHADARNSDYSNETGPGKVSLAWQKKFDGTINLGPTSDAKGHVYITTSADGCHLYSLDANTGEIIWCTDEVNQYAVASSALLDNEGRIFIADDSAMNAFSDTGTLLWKTPIIGFPLSAQFTQTGRLIFITHIGRIYVLDRETGETVMQPVSLIPNDSTLSDFDPIACMRGSEKCPCANTLAFDLHSGRFFFTFWAPGTAQASLTAMVYAEDPVPSVTALWTNQSLSGGSASSPDLSIDGSKVYVNDNDVSIHALDAGSGENIWSFNIGYEPGGSQSTSPKGLIIPAGGKNAGLLAIRDKGTSAELLWRNDSLQNRGIVTQTANNLAYATVKVGQLKYDLVIIDVRSGQELDREHLPGLPFFSVGITIGYDGTIYVPTFNGYLYAYR
ncbi:PQQ-binding-like beta-propeller repeat protein [Chryseolinea sp. H1M3-3]|uniref:outer membrane protein assembly factor BamB family protein n=1 Tax=Chryseolinea sp. H1M3-3 TaxID=3034144 RepID=UPI0023ED1F9E|nr:PQQ-binding-like beta-propeller repeat protein [Chryseolinea sp. H1M3-3]